MSDLKDETLRRAQELADFKLLSSGDIPKIDLYMEQVTSLLEQEMGPSLRRKDESVFTNTMINNYSKEGVLPRPEKQTLQPPPYHYADLYLFAQAESADAGNQTFHLPY